MRDRMVAMIDDIRMGDVRDFRNFMGAVIDETRLRQDQRLHRRGAQDNGDDRRRRRRRTASAGYFIEPTLVETDDPGYRLLCEEIFGPVVTAYVYDDEQVDGDARRSSTGRRRTR